MRTINISFNELEEMGYESVTDYCRFLVKTDRDLTDETEIHVYRDTMRCLTVNNIKEAAKLYPTGTGWRTYGWKASQRLEQARGCV